MGIFNSNIKSTLADEFISSLKQNLNRKVITTCAKWSEKYRVIKGQPWEFTRYPWLRDMHDSEAVMNVGQKAAQCGYTETMLNICFYNIDIHGRDVLYVLPSKTPDAGDFSASRFDPAVEESDHLSSLFSDVKNVGHKRAGSANLYIRGARSRGSLKSIPVSVVICDETDEMPKENVRLSFERTSGQFEKLIWLVSTPSVTDHGINVYFKDSSQNEFYFRCPSCDRFINLTFPDNMEVIGKSILDKRLEESYLKCNICEAKLPHENKVNLFEKARWIQTYSDRDIAGWHINQLYSTTITPKEIAKSYFYSLNDSSFEQEFYNSQLGVTHEVAGARILESQINSLRRDYVQRSRNDYSNLTTMGVDVGYPYIHYEIDEWTIPRYVGLPEDLNVMCHPRVVKIGKVKNMEELDNLMRDFLIKFCVIDAHPERRKAYEFSTRFWGHVRLAFYGVGITGKQIHISNQDEPTLTVDRTSWLDLSLGRFKTGNIDLPKDLDIEYIEHLQAPIRTYEKDRTGNPVATYVNSKADHFAHSRNYAEIALPLALSLTQSQNISSVL